MANTSEKEPSERPSAPHSDWYLQIIVRIAENASLPITLAVGGLLISGHVVHGKKFVEGLAATVSKADITHQPKEEGAKLAKVLADGLAQAGAIYDDAERLKDTPLGFIHLQNARVFHPGGRAIPNDGATWMRLRIDRVDGFWVGSLSEG